MSGLSEERLHAWKRDGYLTLGSVVTPEAVGALRRAEARFRPPAGYGSTANDTLRVSIQLCHRSAAVREFATRGAQVAIVTELLGPDVCLTHQQFITKLPDDPDTHSDIPWHQDNGYGRLDPMTDVTVWVALDDTDERNGCLWIVPGSQRRGLLPHEAAGVNRVLREAQPDADPVALPMRAGEAVAFSGLTLHGSGPNRSERERVGLFVRYCEPHVRMLSEGGRPVLDDPHSWMVAGEHA